MYYFDNAATSAEKPAAVAQAVQDALTSGLYGNPSRGAHGYALRAYAAVLEAKERVKALFRATDAYDVAFTYNATTALNMVLKGLIRPGDGVITTTWEHNAVLRPLYQLQARGVAVEFISSEPVTGQLHYDELENKLHPNTRWFVCTQASNVTGNVSDLERIKSFCRAQGLGLIVDLSQTAGAYPIDLSDGIITAVCFTGHKSLHGPGGTGGLCIRCDADVTPWLTGGDGVHSFEHEQPSIVPGVFEAGTANVAGIMGLSAAVQILLDGELKRTIAHEEKIGQAFVSGIQAIPGITLYGDFTAPHVAVYGLNIGLADSAIVSDILWNEYEMATRPGFHCAPLMHEQLGTQRQGIVRFSFSSYTTMEEVEAAIRAIAEIAKKA